MSKSAQKFMFPDHIPWGWDEDQVPQKYFARNCMKCADLYKSHA